MKHLYLIIVLAVVTNTINAQSFYIATAKATGNWTDQNKWTVVSRTDGKSINSFVIPKNITITLNDNVDLSNSGDVELEISGTLEIRSDKTLRLSENSIISVKAGGVITLDANAKNQANNNKIEQLIIGNKVKFDGNTDSQITGPATATKLTGNSPNGFVSNAMLPVNFVSFTAAKNNESVSLTWTTTDEINNSHFEIQRSTDGIHFKSVAIVLPADDNNNIHQYNYTDKYTTQGAVYYRIRQVDYNGKEKFSSVKVLSNSSKVENNALIYVTGKSVVVDLQNAEGNVMVRLVSLSGSIVSQLNTVASNQKVLINAYNAANGAYVVQVSDSKGLFNSKKVLL